VARDASGNFSAGTITATQFNGPMTGTITGNASTASALQTARTIAISGDVTGTATSFNGTSDITISAAITAGAIVNADIAAAAAIADTKLATIASAGKVANSATTATNANTASAIVARDASGNFSAGTITATQFNGPMTGTITGNASTASALQTPRTIGLSGAVTATGVNFDGTSNIALTTAITALPDSALATISTAGKVSNTATTATSANTANAIVARDASGNFSAGTITATSFSGPLTGAVTGNVTGNASGLSSPASNGLAKAWVNFDGNGTYTLGTPTAATIRSSHNVSTITKNANGDFTVNFSSTFPNADYAVMVTAQGSANNAFSVIKIGTTSAMVTTTSVRVSFLDSAASPQNPSTACVVIFGNW
jgi:hypothetical protein